MNKYEVMYIIAGETPENVREELIGKIETLIVSHGGQVESVEKMGMKRFAYPINYKNEGFYVLVNFSSAPEFVTELERILRINENVVREIVVKKDA